MEFVLAWVLICRKCMPSLHSDVVIVNERENSFRNSYNALHPLHFKYVSLPAYACMLVSFHSVVNALNVRLFYIPELALYSNGSNNTNQEREREKNALPFKSSFQREENESNRWKKKLKVQKLVNCMYIIELFYFVIHEWCVHVVAMFFFYVVDLHEKVTTVRRRA